ncbi:hypothetical protein J6590_008521 [Homalodisca vitripennis]|nr:hypothetical protein J6590_008521 [Homalodisca vitripennis]
MVLSEKWSRRGCCGGSVNKRCKISPRRQTNVSGLSGPEINALRGLGSLANVLSIDGVPQGSSLGPFFIIVIVTDIKALGAIATGRWNKSGDQCVRLGRSRSLALFNIYGGIAALYPGRNCGKSIKPSRPHGVLKSIKESRAVTETDTTSDTHKHFLLLNWINELLRRL